MRNTRITITYTLVLFLAGCTSTEKFTRLYENASIALQSEEWRGYGIIDGGNLVVETSYFKSTLPYVVDGISGYTLYIELSSTVLSQGKYIKIPSDNIKTYLHTLNAPSYDNVSDVKGSIKVVELKPDGVYLEVDVYSQSKAWSYSGVEFFRYAKHSCLGKVDQACEFYSK